LIIHIDEDCEAGAVLVFLPVSLWEPSMYVTSKVNSDCMVYCIQLQTTTFNVGYQMRNGLSWIGCQSTSQVILRAV
jgi:hypothetical protein